jgi:hypothetical protein
MIKMGTVIFRFIRFIFLIIKISQKMKKKYIKKNHKKYNYAIRR